MSQSAPAQANSAVSTAIIGGTGFNALAGVEELSQQRPTTPYGATSAPLYRLQVAQTPCLMLPRHGRPHHIPPHKINYRANLWALRQQGVKRVFAVNAVGGIAHDAGALVIPDQVIDYTYGREHTFFDGECYDNREATLEHIDFTRPFNPALRERLLTAAGGQGVVAVDGGTYAATQGPRLESAAEIQRLARDGCAVVGMTGMPEAALAKELGMSYAMICLVVNPAAGLTARDITMDAIRRVLNDGMGVVQSIVLAAVTAQQ